MFFNSSISNCLRFATSCHALYAKAVVITPHDAFLSVSKAKVSITFCIRMPMSNDNPDQFFNVIMSQTVSVSLFKDITKII